MTFWLGVLCGAIVAAPIALLVSALCFAASEERAVRRHLPEHWRR